MTSRKEGILFLCAVLVELLLAVCLSASHRMLVGHDGFSYLASQYYFLNNAMTSGEIPQWLPFLVQGTVATWEYALQASPLQQLLLCLGTFLKGVHFLNIFYAGIFVDTLFLLVGTWLVSRRFFSSAWTIFFVTIAVAGSSIWVTQPWFNFHFIYALPLMLYFLHTFLERKKWRYLFLTGNLLAFQTLGSPSYFVSVTSLVVFLYALFYILLNREAYKSITSLPLGRPSWACMLGILASLMATYALLKIGTNEIANYTPGRNVDGSVPLPAFLTYGGDQNLGKWSELFLGFSPTLDYSLYLGLLCVPLAGVGLLNLKRSSLHLLCLLVTLVLFYQGTPVATFFYYTWPLMKLYRHLPLTICFIKLFLCLLAGIGFEALFIHKNQKRLFYLVPCAILLALVSLTLFGLAHHPTGSNRLITYLVTSTPGHMFRPMMEKGELLTSCLTRTAGTALLASILLGLCACVGPTRYRTPAILLVLALHVADVYGYKFSDAFLKTAPLTQEQYELTRFQPMPYSRRRVLLSQSTSPRVTRLLELPLYGGIAWITQSFLFFDEPGSSLRVRYWQEPLDHLMKAYWKQPLRDSFTPPAGLVQWEKLIFPFEHPAAGKISGVTQDKIQFFSEATIEPEDAIARDITKPDYAGDVLFVTPPSDSRQPPNASGKLVDVFPSTSSRLTLPYVVERFDSNHLNVFVDLPADHKSAWMLYSGAWHSFWKATVNGKPVPVLKAQLAYLAVPLEPGVNHVHFFFSSKTLFLLQHLLGWNALFWLVTLAGLASGMCVQAMR